MLGPQLLLFINYRRNFKLSASLLETGKMGTGIMEQWVKQPFVIPAPHMGSS